MEQVRKADGQRTDLLSAEAVAAIRDAADNADTARLTELLDPFHEADIADLLEQISPEERSAVIAVWGSNFDGDVLLELDESIREEVVEIRPRVRQRLEVELSRQLESGHFNLAAVDERLNAERVRDIHLDVFVIGAVQRRFERDPLVGDGALGTNLVGGELLGIEGVRNAER